MKFVCIFAYQLYAFHHDDQENNELDKLFEDWTNVGYLEDFFEEHKNDLQNGFLGNITVEQAVKRTLLNARNLARDLLRLGKNDSGESNKTLDLLFTPLDNSEFGNITLSKQKAYGFSQDSWLRLYALKIEHGVYIITGGAIKLTPTMNERDHTAKELEKLKRCRAFLMGEGLIDNDGFKEEF